MYDVDVRAVVLVALVTCVACLSAPSSAPDGGAIGGAGLRRKLVTLHVPQVDSVADMPIAILLGEDADIAAAARSDGLDIRVGDGPGGKQLFHEIEEYDPATGALVLWVNVPLVAEGTVLELRYGDGQERPGNPGAVWIEYAGVWHLSEDPGATTPQFPDSSGNANPGRVATGPQTTRPATKRGIAGGALAFDGTSRVEIGDPESGELDFGSLSFTYEAWVEMPVEPAEASEKVWTKGGIAPEIPGYAFQLGTGAWLAQIADGSNDDDVDITLEPIVGDWVHLVAAVDRSRGELRAYLDGAAMPAEVLGVGDVSTDEIAAIGGSPSGTEGFIGLVDEVRVRNDTMTDARIATQHANLRDPTAFLEVGDEQPAP